MPWFCKLFQLRHLFPGMLFIQSNLHFHSTPIYAFWQNIVKGNRNNFLRNTVIKQNGPLLIRNLLPTKDDTILTIIQLLEIQPPNLLVTKIPFHLISISFRKSRIFKEFDLPKYSILQINIFLLENSLDLKSQLRELKKVLNHRGYPSNIINTEFNKIKHTTQKQLLFEKKRTKIPFNYQTNKTKNTNNIRKTINYNRKSKTNKGKTLPFTIKYFEHAHKLQHILTKHWHLIENDTDLKPIFPNKPFMSFKRHKNLKDILVRSKFT